MKKKYLGAFRLPHEMSTSVTPRLNAYPQNGIAADGFNMGGGPFTIDAARNELVVGTRHSRLARVKLAGVELSMTGNANELPVAPLVSDAFYDVSNDTWGDVSDVPVVGPGLGGVLVVGEHVVAAGKIYYDANNSQRRGHFAAPWPVATPPASPVLRYPWKTVGPDGAQGLIAGYMAPIHDPKWQTRLKGRALAGQGALPIIIRGSAGPCVWSFNPEHLLLAKETAPATMLVGYPAGHWTLGDWNSTTASELYSMATQVTGVAIVDDELVFVGTQGTGAPCYGDAVADVAKAINGLCYDPATSDKGGHAWPYRAQQWVYKLDEVAQVAEGTRDPWSLMPTFEGFDVGLFHNALYQVNGCAFDPITRRFYLGMRTADGYGMEPGPVFLVWEIEPPDGGVIIPPVDPPATDCDKLRAEIVELKAAIDAANLALATTHAELAEKAAQNAKLGEVNAALNQALQEVQAERRAAVALVSELTAQVETLKVAGAKAQANLDALRDTVKRFAELLDLTSKI